MKKNLIANRQPGRVRLVLILLPIGIVLLQSCCFLGPIGIASRKPCNCGPVSTANNNSTTSHPATRAIANQTAGGFAISNAITTTLTEQTDQAFQEMESVTAPDIVSPEIRTITPLPVNTGNSVVQSNTPVLPAIPESDNNYERYAEKKMPLGIKAIQSYITAGPNISFKSSKENYGGTNHKSKPGIGFQFGFGTSYYFSDKFAVAPSLLFKNNNATETISSATTSEPGYGGGGSQEYETKYSYSYLSVPILAEVKLNEQFTVMAGPEVNLLMSAKTKQTSGGSTEKTDIKSSSVKTGVGVQLGVKYAIPNTPVGIQLLYDHRISRLNEKGSDDYGGSYETPAWNMKSVQLGITCALCDLLRGGQK